MRDSISAPWSPPAAAWSPPRAWPSAPAHGAARSWRSRMLWSVDGRVRAGSIIAESLPSSSARGNPAASRRSLCSFGLGVRGQRMRRASPARRRTVLAAGPAARFPANRGRGPAPGRPRAQAPRRFGPSCRARRARRSSGPGAGTAIAEEDERHRETAASVLLHGEEEHGAGRADRPAHRLHVASTINRRCSSRRQVACCLQSLAVTDRSRAPTGRCRSQAAATVRAPLVAQAARPRRLLPGRPAGGRRETAGAG